MLRLRKLGGVLSVKVPLKGQGHFVQVLGAQEEEEELVADLVGSGGFASLKGGSGPQHDVQRHTETRPTQGTGQVEIPLPTLEL